MRLYRRGIMAALGMVLLNLSAARAQDAAETPIAMNRVPAVVLQAARKAAPGVRLTKATVTVEEGKTYFDLIGADAEGRAVDVELTARGLLLGVGTEIPMSEVPRVVLGVLKAKARGMKFTDAESVSRDGRIFAYRFEGETAEGDDVEATVSADGRTVEIDVDDD